MLPEEHSRDTIVCCSSANPSAADSDAGEGADRNQTAAGPPAGLRDRDDLLLEAAAVPGW